MKYRAKEKTGNNNLKELKLKKTAKLKPFYYYYAELIRITRKTILFLRVSTTQKSEHNNTD